MADANRILEILLQLKADTADVAKVTGALKEVEAQAAATTETMNAVKSGGTVDWNQLAQDRAAATAAINATEVEGAEATAAAQEKIALQMERRVILETEIEAAEARIAGNTALATQLEREAEIRARSLGIQRTLNIETEEAILLAERLVLAEEAQAAPTAIAGLNLGKARAESITLARELANGSANGRTLGALLGSLGPTLTIAGLAGYELYHAIVSSGEATLELEKHNAKMAEDLYKSVNAWDEMAKTARTLGDEVKLADKVQGEIDKLAQHLREMRVKDLEGWRSWAGAIAALIGSLPGMSGVGAGLTGALRTKLTEDVKRAQEEVNAAVKAGSIELLAATDHAEKFAEQMKRPGQAMVDFQQQLTAAEEKAAGLRVKLQGDLGNEGLQKAYASANKEVEQLRSDLDAAGAEQDKLNRKTKDGHESQKAVNVALREQAALMAQIRGNQQIVSQNPFMSADEKQAALIPLITQEIAAMNAQLARDQQLQKQATDPGQWQQLQVKIIQARTEVTLLGQKLQTLNFGGTLRADLTSWVNQFGTTAKQVAGIITGTLNTAIASTSQAITSLIFKTGNWKQAFAQAAQSIVQNIIQIALQWVVSRALMSAIHAIFGQEDAATSAATATESAAAWAPAATAASIATEGGADIAGTSALAIAMAAGQGIVTGAGGGGFAMGGYTGGREGAPAGIVHGAEYVFSAPAVRSLGVGYLDSLHSTVSRPGYAKGGFVGGNSRSAAPRGGGDVHVFNFSDPNKLRDAVMNSSAGRKIIVDVVNGHRVELGLA